jgi:hypothetical protein
MSIVSVHSRRALPTQRSATAFVLGACGGVLSTSMLSAVNMVSKLAVNLASRSRSRNRRLAARWSSVSSRFPGLLGHPGAGGMGGHAEDVDLAGGQFDEEEHVDSFEEHGVDGEEVAGQDRVGLAGEETGARSARHVVAPDRHQPG